MKIIPPRAWPRKASTDAGEKLRRPATLGELVESGQGLTAACEICLHSGRLDLTDLSEHLGDEYACSEAALRKRLQCSVCGSRDLVVREIGPSGDADRVPAAPIAILAEV